MSNNCSLEMYRKAAGYSQKEVAEETGATQTMISRWENRKTIPTVDYLQKLFDLYELENIEKIKLLEWILEEQN